MLLTISRSSIAIWRLLILTVLGWGFLVVLRGGVASSTCFMSMVVIWCSLPALLLLLLVVHLLLSLLLLGILKLLLLCVLLWGWLVWLLRWVCIWWWLVAWGATSST